MDTENDKIKLAVVPLRGAILLPKNILTLNIGRESSIKIVEKTFKDESTVFLVGQKNYMDEDPTSEGLYNIGIIGKIMQIFKMDKTTVKILVEGLKRAKIINLEKEEGYFQGEVELLKDEPIEVSTAEKEGILRVAIEVIEEYAGINNNISPKTLMDILTCDSIGDMSNLIAGSMYLKTEVKQKILEETNPLERLFYTIKEVNNEINVLKVQKEMVNKVKKNLDDKQKRHILNEQVKIIKTELGDKEDIDDDINSYKEKMKNKKIPKYVKEKLDKELKRLSKASVTSPENTLIRDYIECLLDLPFEEYKLEESSLEAVEDILNKEHYGLEKVKERILEYLAVRTINSKKTMTVLCLLGAPGTGKTSVAKSIAKALNKEYIKISLGGVRDEADIRGHRKTYIGSIPGRIIYALRQVKVNNPVILLDEIDKLNSDYKGDPSSALLEVLDPEQNKEFRDHYLELAFDLSKVMFICTANKVSTIPAALRDRLEIIELSSYTIIEKMKIGIDYLYPKELEAHNLTKEELKISEYMMKEIITSYTKEAGVRELSRLIEKICRKIVKEKVFNKSTENIEITKNNIEKYLKSPKYKNKNLLEKSLVGVVRGLAWTSVGGETLFIEVNIMPGKGTIELTGKLGDVMKESAKIAVSYIRANSKQLGIEKNFYRHKDIHIHVPEGAVPKDGPSAGIAILTGIVSALTDKKVRNDIAMTGEITLRGNVLPIGGLKEKILAGKNEGIKRFIIPQSNDRDYNELPPYIKEGLEIIFAEEISMVLDNALEESEIYHESR